MVVSDKAQSGREALKQYWLDKLWAVLFDGDSGGLMSPGQIRRERRDRVLVRQMEMEAILQAESDINEIHQGTKALDERGNLIDTPMVEQVSTHRVIENTAIEQGFDLGLETSAEMLRSVVKELSVRDLERSLNIRKIAILAESEVLSSDDRPVSRQPLNAEWLVRWRESAENAFHAESQLLWARILAREVASPGAYSLGSLSALKQLNHDDLQVLQIIGKYAFPSFIYNAEDYFNSETHYSWFEVMEDLGLLNHSSSRIDLRDLPRSGGALYLPCGNKALKVSNLEQSPGVELPIFKLTRIGKQLFPLAVNEADLAYLMNLGRRLKAAGCEVEVGDWIDDDSETRGRFESRMSL